MMFRLEYLVIATVTFGIILGYEIESNFYSEESCSKAKGACVLEKECPHAIDKGSDNLCPYQKGAGAVCCKDFPADKLNCFQRHNDCFNDCPKNLDLGRKGCPKEKTCCVLV